MPAGGTIAMSIVQILLCMREVTHKASVTLADVLVLSANLIITPPQILNDHSCIHVNDDTQAAVGLCIM